MIRNKAQQKLFMDFSHILSGGGKVSDIDMVKVLRNGFVIIGEIKNEGGTLSQGQRALLEGFIDNSKSGGAILYITHNKRVEDGDTEVNVAECQVKEYYYKPKDKEKGSWLIPKEWTSVDTALFQIIASQEQHK